MDTLNTLFPAHGHRERERMRERKRENDLPTSDSTVNNTNEVNDSFPLLKRVNPGYSIQHSAPICTLYCVLADPFSNSLPNVHA